MTSTSESVHACVPLLQWEIVAIETYRQAREQLMAHPQASVLEEIGRHHRDAAALIRTRVRRSGQDPVLLLRDSEHPLPSILMTATAFGEETAIGALIAGEKLLLEEYEAVLESPVVEPQVKAEIRAFRLPRLLADIEALARLRTTFTDDFAMAV